MKEIKFVNGVQILNDEEDKAALLLAMVSTDLSAEIQKHFDAGRYTQSDVRNFVVGGKLTAAKYKTVTGVDYV